MAYRFLTLNQVFRCNRGMDWRTCLVVCRCSYWCYIGVHYFSFWALFIFCRGRILGYARVRVYIRGFALVDYGDESIWSCETGTISIISGIVLALSRNRGSLLAFVCFVLQTAAQETSPEALKDPVKSHLDKLLNLLIIGLICLLMHSKHKKVSHKAHRKSYWRSYPPLRNVN